MLRNKDREDKTQNSRSIEPEQINVALFSFCRHCALYIHIAPGRIEFVLKNRWKVKKLVRDLQKGLSTAEPQERTRNAYPLNRIHAYSVTRRRG